MVLRLDVLRKMVLVAGRRRRLQRWVPPMSAAAGRNLSYPTISMQAIYEQVFKTVTRTEIVALLDELEFTGGDRAAIVNYIDRTLPGMA